MIISHVGQRVNSVETDNSLQKPLTRKITLQLFIIHNSIVQNVSFNQ